MKRLIFFLMLGLAAGVRAQTATTMTVTMTNAPRTYFDAFAATPDTLLIRGMSTIGTLNSQIGCPVEIRAERLTNPQTTNNVYAVSLRTKVDQQTQIDYIDYDELDALIRSVSLISQANNTITPMDSFEAVFRTRSGLSIVKVVKASKTVITMTSGCVNGARNEMAPFVLDELGRYLVAAKTKIDTVMASGQ